MKKTPIQNLEDVFGPQHIHFLSYPVYTEKERKEYSKHPHRYYYEKRYLARDAQCSRVLPVCGGSDQIVIMPKSAKSIPLMNYYRQTYGRKHTGNFQNVRFFESETGYKELIRDSHEETDFPVSVLCPFLPHHIDPSLLYVDADLLVHLNKKNNIHKLTDKVPQRSIIRFSDFDRSILEKSLFYPCVLKGETGSGGDTVRIARSLEGLLEAKKMMEVSKTKHVVIEEYFEHDASYNLQFCIRKNGTSSFLHLSVQKISRQGVFLGNIIDLDFDHRQIPKKMLHVAQEACDTIYKKGFYGLLGIDVLHHRADNRVRIVDINARWNASTTFLLLRKTIHQKSGDRHLSGISILPKQQKIRDIDDVLDDLSPELQKHLFLVGGANRMHPASKYRYRVYAGVTGNSEEEIQERIDRLSNRYHIG